MNYTQRLAEAKLVPSVGSVDSYDNALAETLNGLYKLPPENSGRFSGPFGRTGSI